MLNVPVVGYGRIGKMTVETIGQSDGMKVVTVADGTDHLDVSALQEHVNTIVDFLHPDNLTWIKPFVLEHACTYICDTAGHNNIQKYQVEELSSVMPVVFQTNFSLGIAVFQEVLQTITPILEENFDIEIVEKHHNQKQDTPSDTTKMLIVAINRERAYREVHGRDGFIRKRQKETGMHAVRGDTVAGEYDVYFFGDNEIFEIKYTANSRKTFVGGILRAAHFAITQKPGMYTMKDTLLA